MKDFKMKVTSSLLLCSMLAYTMPVFAYTKDESVFSKLDANGYVYKTTVSNHLKNIDKLKDIKDLSDLTDIENVSGDQEVIREGNSLTWKAEGEDIYYQGNSEKQLPIDCKITYKLDGKEISKDDIAGKSGNVTIILEYTNKEARNVKINGKYETMYVPFVVACGTVINNEKNKNIQITNGKVIDNGTKTVVFGMAMPGMQESLGLSKNKMEIPTAVEISMETKEFEMSSIYVIATPKVFDEEDINVFDELDEIYSKVSTLQTSTNKLEEGTAALKDGMNTAYEGTKLISAKVKTATDSLANNKTDALKKEQVESIGNSAAVSAVSGIKSKKALIEKNAEAGIDAKKDYIASQSISSAKQIAEVTAVSTAQNVAGSVAVATAEATANQTANSLLSNMDIDSLNNAIKTTIIASVAEQKGLTITQVKENEALMQYVEAQYTAKKIDKNKILASVQGQFTDEYKAKISSNAVANVNSSTNKIKQMADAGVDKQKDTISGAMIASSKEIAKQTASATAEKVAGEVAEEVGKTVAGEVANKVKAEALKQVASSMNQLTEGLEQLENGMEELNNGSEQLADGVTKLNNEGIKKISNVINGDVKDLQTRIEKLQELADAYKSYTMIDDSIDGSVKFIMMIDKVEKNTEKEQAVLTNETTEVKEEKEN